MIRHPIRGLVGVAVLVTLAVGYLWVTSEPAPHEAARRRVSLYVQDGGEPSTLRAPETLSVPILAWYDPATKTVSVTEQGRLAGVRCAP